MTGGDYRRSELHSVIEVARNRHRPPRLLTGAQLFARVVNLTLLRFNSSPDLIRSNPHLK